MSAEYTSACPGFRRAAFSRRRLLQVGAAGMLGLSLPSWLRAAGRANPPKARAKAVIFLHQFGGPSQFETFDMKPDAPAEIRGEFKPIASKLPGVPVCEKLPRMAPWMDQVCLIRSMQHTMKNHNSATYYSLTGYAPPVDDIRLRDSPDLFPAYGSVVDKLAPVGGGMPTFVAYPHVLRDGSITPGQHASFLGKSHNPLVLLPGPERPGFRPARAAACRPTCRSNGSKHRREMLKLIDEQSKLLDDSATARGIDETYQRAVGMLTSPNVRQAFDIAKEPAAVRDRYGRTTYGQSCLLARRLVEAGAKFINVYFASSIGGRTEWGRLGHPRLRRQPDVPDPPRLPIANHRPDAANAARRPEGPRLAGHDAGGVDRRVRPQPAD